MTDLPTTDFQLPTVDVCQHVFADWFELNTAVNLAYFRKFQLAHRIPTSDNAFPTPQNHLPTTNYNLTSIDELFSSWQLEVGKILTGVTLTLPPLKGGSSQRAKTPREEHPMTHRKPKRPQNRYHRSYQSPLGRAAGQTSKNAEEIESMRRAAWRKQGVLNVTPSDSRLSWPEREFIKQIAEKLYGNRKEETQ